MKLRVSINQAEAFKAGIDAPKSTGHIEVEPITLDPASRNLIADHMDGIDVMDPVLVLGNRVRIRLTCPTVECLVATLEAHRQKQRNRAIT